MLKITFKHPDGNQYKFPSTIEQAVDSGIHWVLDTTQQCPLCNISKVTHVHTDNCRRCRHQHLMHEAAQNPNLPRSRHRAVELDSPSFLTDRMCRRGDHLIEASIKNNQCLACKREKPPKTSRPLPGHDAPVITRVQARSLGFTHYSTGRPCERGHTCARYVSTGNCVACMRAYP